MALTDILTNIADAIRRKTKTSDAIKLTEMAEKIDDINNDEGEPILFMPSNAKAYAKNLVIPESVTSIGSAMFSETNVESVTIEGAPTMGSSVFSKCNKLKYVTYKVKVESIPTNTYYDIYQPITIRVPWSEGEVSGAPWGAKNATINYNYIEETTQ